MQQQYIYPISSTAKQRETDWICVCPNCQHERIISYSQKWNIEKGYCKKECKSCAIELGLIQIDLSGLKLGQSKQIQEKSAKARTGIKRPKSKEVCQYRLLFNPESFSTPEGRQKQRAAKLGKFGELSNHWEGGKVSQRVTEMSRDQYKQLRKTIFKRDNFTCQICTTRGGDLEMDHIKEWCNYPELRYETTNCRTLCKECHKKTDNYSYKARKKKE